MAKPDWLWMEFSRLFSRYISGKISKEKFELAWKTALKKKGVTQEQFSAKYGGAR